MFIILCLVAVISTFKVKKVRIRNLGLVHNYGGLVVTELW